jgi:hypothetical protein
MTMEGRIAMTLKAAGERIEVCEGRRDSHGSLEFNPRRTTPRWVAFAGAFGAVILVAFGLSLIRSANPRPVTTSFPLSITESGPLVWRRVLDLSTNISVEHLTHGPAGWVALTQNNRQSNDYSNAPILGSEDGVEWVELRSGGPAEAVAIRGAFGHANGYLAFGPYASPNYTVTTVNRPSNFPEPAVWTSVDGVGWTLEPLPLPPAQEAISEIVSYRVTHVVGVGTDVIVFGVEWDEVVPEGVQDGVAYAVAFRQIVWESDQAGDWRLVGESPIPEVEALASGPGGVIAVSLKSSTEVDLWRSDDGINWEQIGSLASVRGGPIFLQGNENGYVLGLGSVSNFSSDGLAWVPLEDVDGVIGGGPGGIRLVWINSAMVARWTAVARGRPV